MCRLTVVCFVAISLLIQVKAAPADISLEDLLVRLVSLEDWKRETQYELSALRETVEQQGTTIKNLERELAIQTNITATLQSSQQDNTNDIQEANEDSEDDDASTAQVSNKIIRSIIPNHQVPVQPSTVNKRAAAGAVAFTAYLDHIVHLGPKQTIIFNQIITNEGSGYDTNSGVFTCPEAGVYRFSFFIGTRGKTGETGQLTAELVVNNQLTVSAVAETTHIQQDLQGGNTVVVRINQGDTVWVEETYSGEHAEGSANLRLTTFTARRNEKTQMNEGNMSRAN